MFRRLLFVFLATLVFATTAAHAQSVRWEPGSGTLALNQVSQLSLVFDQCVPTGNVALPAVSALTFGSPTRSDNTSFSLINGNASRIRTVTLTYGVRPTESTKITIPAFTVETDKGRLRVAAATFEVGDATIGQTGLSTDEVARSRFTFPSDTVWAGEVFPITYTLSASKRYLYNLNKDFEWDSAPLAIEPWPVPEQVEAVLNNDPRISIIYKTRAFVQTPGGYALHPATQLVNITTGSQPFGMFGRANLTQLAVTTPRVDLTVKPLPAPAPATFNGAVGQFTLDSKVVPATAAVGEPITWTLTLDGTGNWPDIPGLPSRSVSKDFRIVQPQAKRTNKDGALFDANITEDIVLIPTKPGRYTLGPVTFTFFNPTRGAYETVTTTPVTVHVAPGGAASVSTAAPGDPESGEPAEPGVGQPVTSARGAIPRDPLPPSGTVGAPLSRPTLLTALLTPLALPLLVWLTLAYRRARATDPTRPQREARIRLANTLRQLASAEKPETGDLKPETKDSALQVSALKSQVSALIQAWQRDTAILWRLPQAVPTPRHLPDAAWSALWSEADRTLYGNTPLPSDWTRRATAALTTRRAPAFSAFQLFLPRNLLPLVAVLALLTVTPSTFAIDPRDAYAAGDWATAETAWTDALETNPTDWVAHHNLALALIQQNRPGEAAGHALAAFVQQPQHPSVRWHLGYAVKAAGASPSALKPFLTDSPPGALARLASPTTWQTLLVASVWLAALALALGIHSAYTKRRRPVLVWSLLAVAVVFGTASVVSLITYGKLADARAVIVVKPTTLRSIPTDLDTQKTTPLSLGTIAKADKTFLGWQRLVFPDGQTGWTRSDAVVPLWTNQTAPAP